MRKVEEKMLEAIESGKDATIGGTKVIHFDSNGKRVIDVFLHGHLIAQKIDNDWQVSLAGWNTTTTRSRLTALLQGVCRCGPDGLGVSTRKGQVYLADALCQRPIEDHGWFSVVTGK